MSASAKFAHRHAKVRMRDAGIIVELPPLFVEFPVALVRNFTINDVKLARLSPREREVFEFLTGFGCAKEIATATRLSLRMVKYHTLSIYRKLGCESRAEFLYKFGKREGDAQ